MRGDPDGTEADDPFGGTSISRDMMMGYDADKGCEVKHLAAYVEAR